MIWLIKIASQITQAKVDFIIKVLFGAILYLEKSTLKTFKRK